MESYTAGAKFDCFLLDMDDTLYPLSLGINLACHKNIRDYMLNKLQIEQSLVLKKCLDLYKEYGTTMAGLKVLGYDFNYDEFHACVHGTLSYEKLKPYPVLRQLLLSLPQRKIVCVCSGSCSCFGNGMLHERIKHQCTIYMLVYKDCGNYANSVAQILQCSSICCRMVASRVADVDFDGIPYSNARMERSRCVHLCCG